jgi:hypothetical protein
MKLACRRQPVIMSAKQTSLVLIYVNEPYAVRTSVALLPRVRNRDAGIPVDNRIQNGRDVGPQCFRISIPELIGMFDANAAASHRFGHLGEIRIPELPRLFFDKTRVQFPAPHGTV